MLFRSGTNSSPEDEYFAFTTGAPPTIQLAPLDWDQRHAFNVNAFVGQKSWGGNVISAEPTKKTCTFCQTEIPIKATRCPHCTSELPT